MMNRISFYGAVTLMLTALIIGGGGAAAPLHDMVIELLAIVLIALTFWVGREVHINGSMRAAHILLLVIVVTPLIQLVPLPYVVWSGLPGRNLLVQIDALLGNAGGWRPISLDSEATWLSAAALLAPAAMFLTSLRLSNQDRRRLVVVLVAGGILSLILAAFQMSAGAGSLRLYNTSHNAFATGLFANRNHQADLLLISMLFASVLVWRAPNVTPMARWGIWVTAMLGLSAGVIATTSRMAFLLLPLAIIGSISFAPLGGMRRYRLATLWGGAAAISALILVAMSTGTQRVLMRFDTLSDVRFDFWVNALAAARQYFPWGSGLGTFDVVYRAVEDLNNVGPAYVNEAHNEYLQTLIELGAWGCLLIMVTFGFFAWLSLRRTNRTPLRRAASFSILVILIHSVVDYPLRTLSLLTVFGFLWGVLISPPDRRAKKSAQL